MNWLHPEAGHLAGGLGSEGFFRVLFVIADGRRTRLAVSRLRCESRDGKQPLVYLICPE